MDLKLASSSATRLDIDSTILHRSLKISQNEDEEFQLLLDAALAGREKAEEAPFKNVKPKPGFCVKTKNLITSQKVFLNICQTDAIPAPADITDCELTDILDSDEPSSFRIPMSLGEGHDEVDKSGHQCTAYDIAINSTFFLKVESNLLFQTFLITLAMEGLEDKYSMELDKNGWNMLKNRKCFGSIKFHKIEQRGLKAAEAETTKSSTSTGNIRNKTLIEEVVKVDTAKDEKQCDVSAKFVFARTVDGAKLILARIPIPVDVTKFFMSVTEEQRVCVKSDNGQEILNVSLPCSVNSLKSCAVFNQHSQILTLILPTM